MRRIEMRRFDNFDDDALPRLVRRQNRALSCSAPTSGWTWKAGALTSYIYCIIKSHAPSSTFQLTFFAPQSFRLFPPCSLSFGSRSFPFSRSFRPPFVLVFHPTFLFLHGKHFHYARHASGHAHQHGCYARARGIAHHPFQQSVSTEFCRDRA